MHIRLLYFYSLVILLLLSCKTTPSGLSPLSTVKIGTIDQDFDHLILQVRRTNSQDQIIDKTIPKESASSTEIKLTPGFQYYFRIAFTKNNQTIYDSESCTNSDDIASRTSHQLTPGENIVTVTVCDANGQGTVVSGPIDWGSQVLIFDANMPMNTIQEKIDRIHSQIKSQEFSEQRYALLFKPGSYNLQVNVGYYMHAAGLGRFPKDTVVNGAVQSKTTAPNGNVTTEFWRAVENFEVHPDGDAIWAVSQATPFRRMHIKGGLEIDLGTGYASGGYIANSVIDGRIKAHSQQQWFTRNTNTQSWSGVNWNVMWLGVPNANTSWSGAMSKVAIPSTPIVREKPFIVFENNQFSVFVPHLKTNSQGVTWASGDANGTLLPISRFFVAKPSHSAEQINQQLASGKNLIITPGIYHLTESLRIDRPDTIVLGIGLPSLMPTAGNLILDIADVDGVIIAGLLLDAGATNSPSLLRLGPSPSGVSHQTNPSSLHDVFCRVGGYKAGSVDACIIVNSNHAITDHLWLWRADHGNRNTVGWHTNPSKNGIIVNGSDVKAYGLFVEHFQEYQVLWNGERGSTYFYQSEIPYDPPNQNTWGGSKGWASYKVSNNVQTHNAWALGIYSFFHHYVRLGNAIEAPASANFSSMVTCNYSKAGGAGIDNIINNRGGGKGSGCIFLSQ